MMSGWKLLILGAVFAGLLAFVYIYEIRGREERELQEAARTRLLPVTADQVTRLVLRRQGEPDVVMEKSGQWRLLQPVQASADSFAVEGLVQSLVDATWTHSIDNPEAARYGLADPLVSVELEGAGRRHVVQFGDKDFVGGSVYVRIADNPRVLLVPDTPYARATQAVVDFRDKTIMEFESESVSQVEIRRGAALVRLVRDGAAWTLAAPSEDRADVAAVDGLLTAIRYGRIQSFAQESLDGLGRFGLDPPAVRIVVSSGDRKAELNLGRQEEGGGYFAYVPGRSVVFTVQQDIMDKAGQPAEKYQSRSVVLFDRARIRRFEVQGEKGKWVAEKQGDQWKVTQPAGLDAKTFLEYRVFLTLEDLKAEQLLAPGSVKLDAPVVTLRADGDERFQVEIFRQGQNWYARSSQTNRLFRIAETQALALNEPVDRFLE